MPMKVSELIEELKEAKTEFGDLDIEVWVSEDVFDDTVLTKGRYDLISFTAKSHAEDIFVISGDTR